MSRRGLGYRQEWRRLRSIQGLHRERGEQYRGCSLRWWGSSHHDSSDVRGQSLSKKLCLESLAHAMHLSSTIWQFLNGRCKAKLRRANATAVISAARHPSCTVCWQLALLTRDRAISGAPVFTRRTTTPPTLQPPAPRVQYSGVVRPIYSLPLSPFAKLSTLR